jgi:hypothetical protein
MRKMVAMGLAALLGGCGDGGETKERSSAVPANAIAVRSAEQEQLHRLDAMARDIGLKRAILASGMRCKRVTESGYVTEHNNLSMWSATCADKRQWAIFVGPDGSAQVRPCDQMAQFKLPECRIGATEKERRGV